MISEFKDKYRWLSNFTPCVIPLNGRLYHSVEHAYQSAKSHDDNWKSYCEDQRNPARKVKTESRYITLIPNWDLIKVAVMSELLKKKYSQIPFKGMLKDTGEELIQEGNTWNDTFWGVDLITGKGQNVLGKLIMYVRDLIIIGEI